MPIDYAPLMRHSVRPPASEGKPFHGKCREAKIQGAREEARQIIAQADQEGRAEADAFHLPAEFTGGPFEKALTNVRQRLPTMPRELS